MLTPQDIVLLREALAYWTKHAVGLELADCDGPAIEIGHSDASKGDIETLYARLALENIHYIVVDVETNHAINSRLFRKVPRLQPAAGRWQIRTVIG